MSKVQRARTQLWRVSCVEILAKGLFPGVDRERRVLERLLEAVHVWSEAEGVEVFRDVLHELGLDSWARSPRKIVAST